VLSIFRQFRINLSKTFQGKANVREYKCQVTVSFIWNQFLVKSMSVEGQCQVKDNVRWKTMSGESQCQGKSMSGERQCQGKSMSCERQCQVKGIVGGSQYQVKVNVSWKSMLGSQCQVKVNVRGLSMSWEDQCLFKICIF